MKQFFTPYCTFLTAVFLYSCSPAQKLSKHFQKEYLTDSAFTHAHVGVAVYDATDQKTILQYNSNKYFVPASNTKIPTLYAGLKYLGNQLPGLQYAERNDSVFLTPTGDPTFLHPDFKQQPVYDFLKQQTKPLVIDNSNFKAEALGYGWAWEDYLGSYMVERSPMPIYGNFITWIQERSIENKEGRKDTSFVLITDPEINWDVKFAPGNFSSFNVTRPRTSNEYTVYSGKETKRELEIPFVTNGLQATVSFIYDTINKNISLINKESGISFPASKKIIYSQPSDSMFKRLMYRSDNFYAEQTLQMVSEQLLGYMDEQKLIDSIIKSEFRGMPQTPKWVDGSGLSRYNLFTPDDFIWLLMKMKQEFGMERLKNLFATGNTGTLRNYYKEEAGFMYAKTGTLSGHVALSGFLYTSKNKLLVFSFLVNNHNTSTTAVRRAVEKFIKALRVKY
ncbi:MAG: D-alanyl-D-alanine carboxypeptidase [Chitinophagaceae bacterium]|nr:D-alanyl-D-alanine carboxypeptidase [Chitinophagaceae bacterium]